MIKYYNNFLYVIYIINYYQDNIDVIMRKTEKNIITDYCSTISHGYFIYCVIMNILTQSNIILLGGFVRDLVIGKTPNDFNFFSFNKIDEINMILYNIREIFYAIYGSMKSLKILMKNKKFLNKDNTLKDVRYNNGHKILLYIDNINVATFDINSLNNFEIVENKKIVSGCYADFFQNTMGLMLKQNKLEIKCIMYFPDNIVLKDKRFDNYLKSIMEEENFSVIFYNDILIEDVVNIIKEFIDVDLKKIFAIMYSLIKYKELFCNHNKCSVIKDEIEHIELFYNMEKRCKKFIKRGFRIINKYCNNKYCIFRL